MSNQSNKVEDLVTQMSDAILAQIKEGTAPWQKSWDPGQRITAHNLQSKNDYMGLNQMWLSYIGQLRGHTDVRWGTYRQIQAAGGQVRKGEKGTPVLGVFEPNREERVAKEEEAKAKGDHNFRAKKHLRSRVYSVFNVSQADSIEVYTIPEPTWEPVDIAEQIAKNSGVEIRHGGHQPAYYHLGDYIQMPEMGQFESPREYYLTLMHELAHATGHESRMSRETLTDRTGRGSEGRAREELRAEISAMLTCTRIGLGHEPNNGASYVDAWSKLLEDQPGEIRSAASEAQKMSTYLLGGMGKGIKLDLEWSQPEGVDKQTEKQATHETKPLGELGDAGVLSPTPSLTITGSSPAFMGVHAQTPPEKSKSKYSKQSIER